MKEVGSSEGEIDVVGKMREGPVMEGRETEIDQGYKIQEIGSPDNIQNPDPHCAGRHAEDEGVSKTIPVISQTDEEGAAQNQGPGKFGKEIAQFQEPEKSGEEIVQVQNIANLETYIEDQIGNVQIQEFNAENFLETNPKFVAGLDMENQDTASSEYVVSETQVLHPKLKEPAHCATSADTTLQQEIERVTHTCREGNLVADILCNEGFCWSLIWVSYGLCRRQVFWISKQILQLVMEDAIDDWLLRQIYWLRREDVIAQGIRWVQDVRTELIMMAMVLLNVFKFSNLNPYIQSPNVDTKLQTSIIRVDFFK
ncbi:hypothetical protein EZV62_011567 [Acer yangbiense]|uniref:Sorting nexin C-terminal domain-containing protein n=1 Tax=Acer yangbiense TaxID=1000413 RepID=A0A5C7I4X2_9ROSI|nr:hypothetical protein EZV62_011567 [Acer yangbiense]